MAKSSARSRPRSWSRQVGEIMREKSENPSWTPTYDCRVTTADGGRAPKPRPEIVATTRTHALAITLMVALAVVMYGFVYLGLVRASVHGQSAWSQLRPSQQLDLGCFVFLISWWIAYFSRSSFTKQRTLGGLQLFTLRSFLNGISSHRGTSLADLEDALSEVQSASTNPQEDAANADERALRQWEDNQRDEKLIREKARSSRDVQGILIAVVVLLLTLVVVDRGNASPFSEYHVLIEGPIFAVAIVITLMWGMSIDIFDTMLNSFQVDIREANELRRHFYAKIGPLRPIGGAVSYGYIGHALMPIFVLMVFSWFEPVVAAFGTALYVLFAYPYYYGYWGLRAKEVNENFRKVNPDHLPLSWALEGNAITRWVVNRDGDQDVLTIDELLAAGSSSSHVVEDVRSKERSQAKIDTQYWPPWLLCGIFLVPSALIMFFST